ncbi:MAG: YqgE/AlgH family protein [Cytophagales bacterium]|nr:MAG: YqgE/AlgH family protein [Cytophagales bacterium]
MTKSDILIAEPFMDDPNFSRSVILLCEKNEEGAMGLVLNKPTEILVGDVIADLNDFQDKIYIGGPVAQDTVHFIHRYPNRIKGDLPLSNGLYWGGNFQDLLSKLFQRLIGIDDIRFFLGYSGWTNEQLDLELQQKAWITTESNVNTIFEQEPKKLWSTLLKNMGGKYKEIANYPLDPRLN